MTQDEIFAEARAACRYPTGHPDDRGQAVLHITPYGIVAETPSGVYELRREDGKVLGTAQQVIDALVGVAVS